MKGQVATTIIDYVKRHALTDYAVLINGPWGTGKTTYWKKYIDQPLRDENFQVVYVSLFGKQTTEQISRAIFTSQIVQRKRLSFLSSKKVKAISELGKMFLSVASSVSVAHVNIKPPNTKIDIGRFLNMHSQTVLCFDDLERTSISFEELFGYINEFVERDNVKVVFIGSEQEIQKKPEAWTTYKSSKEKLIRMTLSFDLNLSRVVTDLINSGTFYKKDSSCVSVLVQTLPHLINFFDRAKIKNLRIIRHSLELFADIHNVLSDKFPDLDVQFYQRILFFMLAVSAENALNEFDVKLHLNHDREFAFYMAYHLEERTGTGAPHHDTPIRDFISKYFVSSSDFYYCLPVINFIVDGYLDKKALLTDIQRHFDESPAGRNSHPRNVIQLMLQQPWELDDDEFVTAFSSIVSNAENGQLPLTNYPSMFSQLASFVTNDAIDYDIETLKLKFLSGIQLAKMDAKYDSDINRITMHLAPLSGQADEAQNEIISVVKQVNGELLMAERKQKAESLISVMQNNFNSFCSELYQSDDYRLIPVIHQFDASLFASTILSKSNSEIITFRNALRERFRSTNIHEYLSDEFTVLSTLNDMVQEYRHVNPKTFHSYVLSVLSQTLMEIVLKLHPVTATTTSGTE